MDKKTFEEILFEMGLNVDELIYNQFEIYRTHLLKWNEFVNLTRIVEKDDVYKKHFLDSLSVFLSQKIKKNSSILDIGTGAGFPGLPMKIFDSSLRVTLMDALKKRVDFLDFLSHELSVKVECVHGRAEDFGQDPKYRENYDIVVSRAVSNLSILLEYTVPFVKKGGYFIALKGKNYQDEISSAKNALQQLGVCIERVMPVNIPKTNTEHQLIIIKKDKSTSKMYPRRAGMPSKNPL